jgi:hypothetical protein
VRRRPSDTPAAPSVISKATGPWLAWAAERLDGRFHWDRLPVPLGVLTLIGLRQRLRERNLYDPGLPPHPAEHRHDGNVPPASLERSIDGSGTHPAHPRLGAVGTRFGRNAAIVPESDLAGSLPAPQAVSDALLKRDEFKPATSLNLLAAAWLQFEVHDWFAHQVEAEPEQPLGLSRLRRDSACPIKLPVFLSDQTHWWDASQLYGANPRFAAAIRSADWEQSGKLEVDDELLEAIAQFVNPSEDPGRGAAERPPDPVPNLWVGLALFQVVFAREHNAICDRLREAHPGWSGARLYAKARLVNVAVMAKIHTVEWTPALIAHPTTVWAIRATWWGLLGERVRRRFGRIGATELWSGIPGSRLDDEVPYAITEEFVAVYRLHPLIPDGVTFHRAADGAPMEDLDGGPTCTFEELAVTRDDRHRARRRLGDIGVENAWYSLAIGHPGALILHNYPTFEPLLDSGQPLDLGAADILRVRECGVPRYNVFRRSLRLPPPDSFHDLAGGDPDRAREIEQVYDSVEDVDLTVGLLAERKPAGFAISDTAFRIFLLMAARRLRSDPFFTTHYKRSVYTRPGLDWIEEATMAGILRRHYPALEPALRDVDNPFKPWPQRRAAAVAGATPEER